MANVNVTLRRRTWLRQLNHLPYILAVCGGVALVLSACHKPSLFPPPDQAPAGEKSDELMEETKAIATPPPPVRLPVEAVDPDRWIFVEKTRDGAPGGWATGSFDPQRNKLTIRERGVQRFTIDVSRIPINWARLVVIGINGRNSELRKRDYSILHFARDQHGQWIVVEP